MSVTSIAEASPRSPGVGARELTYSDYLYLDQVLSSQQPRVHPPHHDELLFIVHHQIVELWFKVLLHELDSARRSLSMDRGATCLATFARTRAIQAQLVDQWSVLETLTPGEFARIRPFLGRASGLESWQYRALELMLGRRHPGLPAVFRREPEVQARLRALTGQASLFDEFLRYLRRRGHPVSRASTERDWAEPRRVTEEDVLDVLRAIHANPAEHREEHLICLELAALDAGFQTWRRRHLEVVRAMIGGERGTAGTAGADYLARAVDRLYFPELAAARA